MSNWIKVFTASDDQRVWMLKDVLMQHGMEPVIINKKDTAYGFGYYDLMVATADADRAKEIIADIYPDQYYNR